MDVPVTDPYYAEYWARVEELGLPIVWHVGDPEEFWDPAAMPAWAREKDWGYGPEDVRKEQLYGEVDEVLARHPRIRVTFAHFYFLSADLPLASRFLDSHPSVRFDLTPGIEMLYNISEDPAAGREFFIRYADRLVFGTDIFSDLSPQEARIRAGIVFRWLETDDTFRVPPEADLLLGPPEDGIIRGMALPEEVLARIYRENFLDQVGPQPRALDRQAAIEECHRLARIAESISGITASQTEAGRVAELLSEQS
jgi:predicted TIM-barrel fold metal-dependent hydrolase